MTDKELDQLKQFFDKYSSKEEFIEKYISVKNPSNSEAIIQLLEAYIDAQAEAVMNIN